MTNEIVLAAHGILFCSPGDEKALFDWLDRIPCISKYGGSGQKDLYLHIATDLVDEVCLRELIALFFRYDIDMVQLKRFETDANRPWFKDPQAYWYESVFTVPAQDLK